MDDDPEHVCCSCERQCQRKSVTRVQLSDDLGGSVWWRLKSFILERDPYVSNQLLYMCNYCKPCNHKEGNVANTLCAKWTADSSNTTRTS